MGISVSCWIHLWIHCPLNVLEKVTEEGLFCPITGFLCGLLVTEGTELASTKFSVVVVQPSNDDKPDKFLSPRALNWPCMGTGVGLSFQGHLRFPAHALK